jgi:hypothetical protein
MTFSREIFAIWTPFLQLKELLLGNQKFHNLFYTDSNGLELVSRQVFQDESYSFSASFVPVESMISMADVE